MCKICYNHWNLSTKRTKFNTEKYDLIKATVPPANRTMFKIDFIVLNESRKRHLQFTTNRIIIGPLEPKIQPVKGS